MFKFSWQWTVGGFSTWCHIIYSRPVNAEVIKFKSIHTTGSDNAIILLLIDRSTSGTGTACMAAVFSCLFHLKQRHTCPSVGFNWISCSFAECLNSARLSTSAKLQRSLRWPRLCRLFLLVSKWSFEMNQYSLLCLYLWCWCAHGISIGVLDFWIYVCVILVCVCVCVC